MKKGGERVEIWLEKDIVETDLIVFMILFLIFDFFLFSQVPQRSNQALIPLLCFQAYERRFFNKEGTLTMTFHSDIVYIDIKYEISSYVI